jgi:hypothetical protein
VKNAGKTLPRFSGECAANFSSEQLISFLIPTVSLTGLHFSFGFALYVLSQRASLIVRLLELSLIITANIPFVVSRIYQLAFAASAFVWHFILPNSV